MDVTKTCLLALLACSMLFQACQSAPLQEVDLAEAASAAQHGGAFAVELLRKRSVDESDSDSELSPSSHKRMRRYVQLSVLRKLQHLGRRHPRRRGRTHHRNHRRPYGYRRYQVSNS